MLGVDVDMPIGKRIEMLRKEHNISQRQLAEAIDVSRKAVSRWENGDTEPDNLQLVLIARTLGIDMKTLTCGTDRAKEIAEMETVEDVKAEPVPDVQVVEKVVERVRVVEKPVIEYVEKPVVKKIIRVKHQRNPIEFALVGGLCFLAGLLIGIFI